MIRPARSPTDFLNNLVQLHSWAVHSKIYDSRRRGEVFISQSACPLFSSKSPHLSYNCLAFFSLFSGTLSVTLMKYQIIWLQLLQLLNQSLNQLLQQLKQHLLLQEDHPHPPVHPLVFRPWSKPLSRACGRVVILEECHGSDVRRPRQPALPGQLRHFRSQLGSDAFTLLTWSNSTTLAQKHRP